MKFFIVSFLIQSSVTFASAAEGDARNFDTLSCTVASGTYSCQVGVNGNSYSYSYADNGCEITCASSQKPQCIPSDCDYNYDNIYASRAKASSCSCK